MSTQTVEGDVTTELGESALVRLVLTDEYQTQLMSALKYLRSTDSCIAVILGFPNFQANGLECVDSSIGCGNLRIECDGTLSFWAYDKLDGDEFNGAIGTLTSTDEFNLVHDQIELDTDTLSASLADFEAGRYRNARAILADLTTEKQ